MPIISKSITIEMGHRLQNHNGKCRNLHGHSYKLELFINGPIQTSGPGEGMVIDFSIVKAAMQKIDFIFDHVLCLQYNDPLLMLFDEAHNSAYYATKFTSDPYVSIQASNQKIVLVDLPPTAEVLASIWLAMMVKYFNMADDIDMSLKVWETETSSCEVHYRHGV